MKFSSIHPLTFWPHFFSDIIILKLGKQLHTEWTTDKHGMEKHHQNEMVNLKKEHKKELDTLMRRYNNQQATLNALSKTQAELEVIKTKKAAA